MIDFCALILATHRRQNCIFSPIFQEFWGEWEEWEMMTRFDRKTLFYTPRMGILDRKRDCLTGLNCFDNPLLWAQKGYLGHFRITLSIKCLCDLSERKNDSLATYRRQNKVNPDGKNLSIRAIIHTLNPKIQ